MRMSRGIIVSLTVTYFLCEIWLRVVEQAFLQSKPLPRNVFAEAPCKVKLSKDKVLEFVLPHLGFDESSSCFFDKCYPVLVDLSQIVPCLFDPYF